MPKKRTKPLVVKVTKVQKAPVTGPPRIKDVPPPNPHRPLLKELGPEPRPKRLLPPPHLPRLEPNELEWLPQKF